MNDKVIQQVSIDIEGIVDLDEVVDILRQAGIKVEGIAWKATWNARDYWEGKAPISSD